jgi:putative NADH-flavin reductase
MKIAVFGPTGPLGRQIVTQALERGHEVTALARSPEKLGASHARLRVVKGDVFDGRAAIEPAVAGQDAVVSALGVGRSFKAGGLIARAMPILVEAMERQNVRRLIFTSGLILKLDQAPLLVRLLMRLLMSDLMRDKKAGEDVLRKSRLDWTLVYPVGLTDKPKTGKYRSGERLALRGFPMVSRADVADLILNLLDDAGSIQKDILISN